MADERLFYRELGQRIRIARTRAELTQQDLADEVDLVRTSITNIENGNQPVSTWLLSLIAAAVQIEPADLLPPHGLVEEVSTLPPDVPAGAAAAIRRWTEQR